MLLVYMRSAFRQEQVYQASLQSFRHLRSPMHEILSLTHPYTHGRSHAAQSATASMQAQVPAGGVEGRGVSGRGYVTTSRSVGREASGRVLV